MVRSAIILATGDISLPFFGGKSCILAFADQLVHEDRYAPGYLGPLGENEVKIIIQKGMPALSEKGVLGDPTKASAEKGAVYLEKTVSFLIGEIKKQLE